MDVNLDLLSFIKTEEDENQVDLEGNLASFGPVNPVFIKEECSEENVFCQQPVEETEEGLSSEACPNIRIVNVANPPGPVPRFHSEAEFTAEMEMNISDVVKECVCVLQRDPREYHPFYLRVYKYATLGKQLGYLGNEEGKDVDAFWKRWDDFATRQWQSKGECERFDGDHSPYLQYLLRGRVILNGEKVKMKKTSRQEKNKLLQQVEEAVRNLQAKWRQLSSEVIRERLDWRREFFEQAKHVTNPVNVGVMNKFWRDLLKEEEEDGERRSSSRKRKPPKWLQEETDTGPKRKRKTIKTVNEKKSKIQSKDYERKKSSKRDNPSGQPSLEIQVEQQVKEIQSALGNNEKTTSDNEIPKKSQNGQKNAKRQEDVVDRCPHCQKKSKVTLERHIARMHVITLDGKVINRPCRKDLEGLNEDQKKEVWKEWQRQRSANKTAEEKLEESRRLREKYWQKIRAMTDEEREEWKKRQRFYRLQKRLEEKSLPEEEQERRKMSNWLRSQAIMSEKGKDWKRQKIEKVKAWNRKKRSKMTEKDREEERRKHREYRKNLQGEKLQRYRDSVRKSVRKYFEKLKKEDYTEWWNKTTGKQRVRWGDLLNYQRERVRNETKEQRENRLLRYRVNQAKRKRRQELEQEGVQDEETIERELKLVEETVKSQPREETRSSEYKPRPGARKPHKVKNARIPPWEMKQDKIEVESQIVEPTQTHQEQTVDITQLVTFQPTVTSVEGSLVQTQTFSVEFHHQTPTLTLVQSTTEVPVLTINPSSPPSSHRTTIHTFNAEVPAVHVNFPCETVNSGAGFGSVSEESPKFIFLTEEQAQTLQPLTEGPPQIILLSGPLTSDQEHCPELSSHEDHVELPGEEEQDSAIDSNQESPMNRSDEDVKLYPRKTQPEASLPPSKQPAICDTCGRTFTTQASLQLHKNLVHPADPSILTCPKCHTTRTSTISLWNHFITHHLSSELDPLLPESIFPKKSNVSKSTDGKPLRNDPGGNLFTCSICSKSFVQKCTLVDHVRRVHEGKGHFCDICGKDQQSTAKLWRHKVERHGQRDLPPPEGVPLVTCKYCQDIVMRGYEQHVRKRHPNDIDDFLQWYMPDKGTAPKSNSSLTVQCPHCPSVVKAKLLNRHIKHMHTVRPKHPCPECGFQFKRLDHMKKHFRDHHAVADIEKKLEAKQFIRVDSLSRNFLVTCLLCQQDIDSKVLLRAHFVQEHHEIFQQCQVATLPIFECVFCLEKFGKESELKKHLEDLHRENLKTCQHCGIWKVSEAELKVHEKSHHKMGAEKMAKQGKCLLCDFEAYGANLNETLRYHVKTEHEDKFVACPNPQCDKWAISEEDLKNHVVRCQKINSKEFVEKTVNKLLVRCEECGVPQRLYQLEKHRKRKHAAECMRKIWNCGECRGRSFKDQRFYIAHMHLFHQKELEELLDLVESDRPGKKQNRIGPKSQHRQETRRKKKFPTIKKKLNCYKNVENEKRLQVRLERLSDDLVKYYLARQIIVKLETNMGDY